MEWISVKDGLPEKTQKVDVWIDNGRFPEKRIADCWHDGTVFCKGGLKGEWIKVENVTHWMLLPKPPKNI